MNATQEQHRDLLNQLCKSVARLTQAHITRELFNQAKKANHHATGGSDWDSATISKEESDASAAFWTLHKLGEEVGLITYNIQAAKPQVTNV
jgi:hypothetical protein